MLPPTKNEMPFVLDEPPTGGRADVGTRLASFLEPRRRMLVDLLKDAGDRILALIFDPLVSIRQAAKNDTTSQGEG